MALSLHHCTTSLAELCIWARASQKLGRQVRLVPQYAWLRTHATGIVPTQGITDNNGTAFLVAHHQSLKQHQGHSVSNQPVWQCLQTSQFRI